MSSSTYQFCKDKRRYHDEAHAKEALQRIQGRAARQGQRRKTPCRAYLCPHCKGWHLTSSEGRVIPSSPIIRGDVPDSVAQQRKKKADEAFARLEAMRRQRAG